MPYGYGASQAYHDRAVRESNPRNQENRAVRESNPRNQGNQISEDLDRLLQQSNQVSTPINTQQDQGGWSPAAGRDESIVSVNNIINTPIDPAEKQQREIKISQDNYNLYGDDLSKWPADDKLQAKQSGFFGMQAEGMLGGVTEHEKQTNALKKLVLEGGPGSREALAGLTRLHGGNKELAKLNALGIEKYLERKTKGNYGKMDDILKGNIKIEGLENFNFDKFIEQTGGLDKVYYNKNTGKETTDDDPDAQSGIWGDALGYDPSAVHTWGDVESDPWLSEAYKGLTTGDPTRHPDWLHDKYLNEILYSNTPRGGDNSWDSWEDSWYGGHIQGGDDSMSDMARHYWFSESLDDVSAREAQRKEEGLGVASMMDMEQMYDKNFAAKANPLLDPGFSEFAMGGRGTTAAEDIMYSKGLFETART